MITRELLGTAEIPGGGELRLFRRPMKGGDEFSITLGGNELMNSRLSGSEEALATLSCKRLVTKNPSVLIGGYGMGFTLRAALSALPNQARVEVVELIPAIVDWARGPMIKLSGNCLSDRRVKITLGDIAKVINNADREYDAILLDVDNGPDGLTQATNDLLYSMQGLTKAKMALRPDGILAIWSSGPNAKFTRRLSDAGFVVDENTVAARTNGKGAKHIIWQAMKI